LAKLVDLPLEVLVGILVLLEWQDILRVRQVVLYFNSSFHLSCDSSVRRAIGFAMPPSLDPYG
jgi:hypothetical protein